MSLFNITFSEIAGAIIRASRYNRNWSDFLADYNGNITNDNISATAAIVESKLSLNYPTHPQNATIPIDINLVTAGTTPPSQVTIDGVPTLYFAGAGAENVYLRFLVPSDYSSSQITLKLKGKSDQASGLILFSAVSSLLRGTGTAAITDPIADKYTSTYAGFTINSGNPAGYPFTISSLDLTTSGGLINSIPVAAGDLISVLLQRGSDGGSNVNLWGLEVNY